MPAPRPDIFPLHSPVWTSRTFPSNPVSSCRLVNNDLAARLATISYIGSPRRRERSENSRRRLPAPAVQVVVLPSSGTPSFKLTLGSGMPVSVWISQSMSFYVKKNKTNNQIDMIASKNDYRWNNGCHRLITLVLYPKYADAIQERYIEELSTCFNLDTALLKSLKVYYLKLKYSI